MPHSAAGSRIDAPVSDPSAAKHIPEATAAADPLLEPPEICAVLKGFFTGPKNDLSPVGPYANS